MNINDIWNGFLAIYNRVTPALLITIAAVLAIILSCRGVSIRSYLAARLSALSKSKGLSDFANTVEQLRLGALVPVIAVVLLLAYLVILGDLVSWISWVAPAPIQASYTPIDILAEQRTPDDLTTIAAAFLKDGTSEDTSPPQVFDPSRLPDFYMIIHYYERQRQRLQNKYPERFKSAWESTSSDITSGQGLYGGFIVLTIFFLFQLIMRKVRPNWLWFNRTTFLRTIIVIMILLVITCRYRLQWEWATERNLSTELNITADVLREENKLPSPDSLPDIKHAIETYQRNFTPNKLWLARYYDRITLKLWGVSHRQLN